MVRRAETLGSRDIKMAKVLTESRIKQALKQYLRKSGKSKNAKLITEMCVDGFSRRADVVLVNGKLTAFEIKGELDSLYRLDGQIETFRKFFESVVVVCAEKHTGAVLSKVPQDVGVWQVNADGNIDILRVAAIRFNGNIDIWLSFLPVRALQPIAISKGLKIGAMDRVTLLSALRLSSVEGVRSDVLAFLKSSQRVLPSCKQSQRKSVATDPIALQLQHIQEFLAKTCNAGGSALAIPRRIASH